MISENTNVFILSVLIGFVSIVGAYTFNHYNELKSIEKNIDSAITKGIEPIAVRCAYRSNSSLDATSSLCAIYIARIK